MKLKFILPVLENINLPLLVIALITIVFFFFFVKVKFQKQATTKTYGIFFYAFVFYSIAALSFVILNSLDSFLKLNSDLYSNIIWAFPIGLLSAGVGALCGWLIYFSASKIAENYALQMLNLSLIIIAPAITYSLLVKPFNQTLNFVLPVAPTTTTFTDKNDSGFEELFEKPNEIFEPAIPALVHDSLDIEVVSSKTIQIRNKTNGFTYSFITPIPVIENLYVIDIPSRKYLAVLALSPGLDQQAGLFVFNNIGDCIFQKKCENYPNQLSASSNGKYLLLQKQISLDSNTFNACFQLK